MHTPHAFVTGPKSGVRRRREPAVTGTNTDAGARGAGAGAGAGAAVGAARALACKKALDR